MLRIRRLSAGATLALLLAGTGAAQEELPTLKIDRVPSQPAFAGQTRAPAAASSDYEVEVVAAGLSSPRSIAFLPGGEILIAEFPGSMRILDAGGDLTPTVAGLPEISTEGWAGLFDMKLDPDFATNRRVFFSYTTADGVDEKGEPRNRHRIAAARLDRAALRLTDTEIIVDGYGGQELHFAADGSLLVSGAGNVFTDDAQDPSITFGKLLRLNRDGSIPDDNPWAGIEDRRPEVLSYGHRDISGLATHPVTSAIWMVEHGPRGGDELNIIEPGANYGWKRISYGTEYTGEPIGDGLSALPGMVQPVYFWRPSIAPSGLVFYTGDMFPEWRHDLFVSALSGEHIARLELDGDRVAAEERLLVDRGQRIRALRVGPDGALYVLTNETGDAPPGTAELLRIYR
jgi:glucose/arabinose dehydrogenase